MQLMAVAGVFYKPDPEAPGLWTPGQRILSSLEYWFLPEWSASVSKVFVSSPSHQPGSPHQQQPVINFFQDLNQYLNSKH